MAIKWLFLDVEGALVNQHGHLTSLTRSTLQRVNLPITLVSSQSPQDLTKFRRVLPISGIQITFDGALILNESKTTSKVVSKLTIPFETSFPLINTLANSFPQIGIYCFDENTAYHIHGPRNPSFTTASHLCELSKRDFHQDVYKISLFSDSADTMRHVVATLDLLPMAALRTEAPQSNQLDIFSSNAQVARAMDYVLTRDCLLDSECVIFRGAVDHGWPHLQNTIQISPRKLIQKNDSEMFYIADHRHENSLATVIQHLNHFIA